MFVITTQRVSRCPAEIKKNRLSPAASELALSGADYERPAINDQ
jgi:hypothetical protein